MIEQEKAKELFLKYYRICQDVEQSKESACAFCDKFILKEEDVEYWSNVKNEVALIEN
jgi:hypothetical protein